MSEPTIPAENDSTTIAMLRRRLSDLEEAVENYFEVLNLTSEIRNTAMARVIGALTVDFKGAILSSADMTDEQRSFWLDTIAQEDAKKATESEAPQ